MECPVPATEPLSATLKRLEFTHGYNLFTRQCARAVGMPREPNLIPYVGAGLGVAIPHVEVQRVGAPQSARTDEYQITGPALQLLGGIEWRFGRRLSLFVEYKLSCAMIHGDLVGGGEVSTNLCTHQLPGGWRCTFGRERPQRPDLFGRLEPLRRGNVMKRSADRSRRLSSRLLAEEARQLVRLTISRVTAKPTL